VNVSRIHDWRLSAAMAVRRVLMRIVISMGFILGLIVVLVICVLRVLRDLMVRIPSETNQAEDNGLEDANAL
jgi:flagellar biogenesis protein FliO